MGSKKGLRRVKDTPDQGHVLTMGSLSHVGMKRSSNQDAYCALVGANSPPGTDALLAVADGMGGHQAGEVASGLAIQILASHLSRDGKGDATLPANGRQSTLLEKVMHEANAEVHRGAARPETSGMGTTLTSAILVGSAVFFAHIGDSRAYLYKRGTLRQLTQDHSWVAEQVARGVLTQQRAREHPKRNVLTRALGIAPSVQVDGMVFDAEEGDILLICSDGLHSLVSDEDIARTLARVDPQDACESLVKQANALGGHDNITVVIARIDHLRKSTGHFNHQQNLHQRTTMELRALSSLRRKIAKALLIPFLPLWLPVWLFAKLARGS